MSDPILDGVVQRPTMESPADIRRRLHAVNALAAFGVLLFVGWISVNVIQVLVLGYGLGIGDGYVQPGQIGEQSGQGWLGDVGLLAMTVAIDALIVGDWAWLAPRLRIEGDRLETDEVAKESWYVPPVPNLTRVLIGVVSRVPLVSRFAGRLSSPTISFGSGGRPVMNGLSTARIRFCRSTSRDRSCAVKTGSCCSVVCWSAPNCLD